MSVEIELGLPVIVCAIALIVVRPSSFSKNFGLWQWLAAGAAACAVWYAAGRIGGAIDLSSLVSCFSIGAAASLLSGTFEDSGPAFALSAGAAAFVASHLFTHQSGPWNSVALIAGASTASILRPSTGPAVCALAISSMSVVWMIAHIAKLSDACASVAYWIVVAGAAILLLKKWLPLRRFAAPLAAGAVVVVAELLANKLSMQQPKALTPTLLGAGWAVLTCWLVSDDQQTAGPAGLAALASVGVAIGSFAVFKGFGIALALAAAAPVLAASGSSKALLASSPIAILALRRVLVQMLGPHVPDFDIAPELAAGAVVAGAIGVGAAAFLVPKRNGVAPALIGLLAVFALLAAPWIAAVLQSRIVLLGLIFGVAAGPALAAGAANASGLSAALALAASGTFAAGMTRQMTLTRAYQSHLVRWTGFALIAMGATAAALIVLEKQYGADSKIDSK